MKPTAIAKVCVEDTDPDSGLDGVGNSVYEIELLTPGSGYIKEPSVTIASVGDGSGATATVRLLMDARV